MGHWSASSQRRLFAVLALVVLAACSRPGPTSRPPEPGDQAVAVVGDQTVWASDVRREAEAQGLIGEGEPLDVGSQTFRQVLEEVIDQKLMAAEAAKRRLDHDPAVKRRIAAARERILADALIDQETAATVTDSAIKGLYDEQVRLAGQTDEFHIHQIVAASQADADAARKLVASGQAFDAAAGQRSIDAASRDNGGDLGYVAADVLPQAYAAALANARPGDLVGPFKSDAGWVVLKLDDRRPEPAPSMDEARPQIVSFLHFSKVRDVIERLRQKTPPRLLIAQAPAGPEPASAPASSAPPPAASVAPAPPAASSSAPPAKASTAPAAPPAPSRPPLAKTRDVRERLRQNSPPTPSLGPAQTMSGAPPAASSTPAAPVAVAPAAPVSSAASAAAPTTPEKTP